MRRLLTVVSLIAVIAASQACASRRAPAVAGYRPPAATTPRIEITGGVNMVQLPSAQFPGFMASAAVILPKTPTWGVGIAGDVESSYLVQTAMAGVRVYGRNRPLFGDGRTVTGFAQLLVGQATGGVQGVLSSEGGLAITPSVGVDYGAGPRAFHLQAGYRHVGNGVVHDARTPEAAPGKLSRTRVVVGMTWRFRAR